MDSDQEFIALITQIVLGLSTVILTIFKYRELLAFLWKMAKICWKPAQCVINWIKLARKLEKSQANNEERLFHVEGSVAELDKFVREKLNRNGGSSLADALKRIEQRQIASESRQEALLNDSKLGFFYCSLDGKNTWVNKTYARFLDCGTNELEGFGWRKFIRTEELSRYSKVWEAAFRDGCEFEDTVEFVNAHGQRVNLHVSLSAVQNENKQVISYIGQVMAL